MTPIRPAAAPLVARRPAPRAAAAAPLPAPAPPAVRPADAFAERLGTPFRSTQGLRVLGAGALAGGAIACATVALAGAGVGAAALALGYGAAFGLGLVFLTVGLLSDLGGALRR